MRLLILTRYASLGASSRIRFLQYLPYLRNAGIDVQVAPLLADDYLLSLYAGQSPDWRATLAAYAKRVSRLAQARRFDLLWIEYEMFPWLPVWFERLLIPGRVPYVVEYDDAVFHRYDTHRMRVVRALLGRKIDDVMRRAAAVIAGNTYLAERAKRAGARRVEMVPSVVDMARYTTGQADHAAVFTFGWIGSPTTTPYLSVAAEGLRPLLADRQARLVLVGAGTNPFPEWPVELVTWTEAGEVDAIKRFDVGLLPLPDGPWERGKCGYKLIQYLACGKAAIASPVGANESIVCHGETGLLAGTPAEWTDALRRLMHDAPLRERLGTAGRALVEREYSLQVTGPRVAALLREMAR